ncbi:hypothetical protein HELRODRAFT_69621 [Helobdella robusta]|uniref:Cilia- and flagella-associated protein 251 n=1 Tax=Helobdella robusta TaxID=6412 RepID=T1FZX3_HELRO|nr:hypothetical protein HELRODRAFT_69621 [Helobdella robusta]ESN92618.1 hypothetical protein HELRODRAFT_69621 [Helobdella robusta]
MAQPPDELDVGNEPDTIEPNYEVNCPLIKLTTKPQDDGENEEEPRTLLGIPLSLVKCFGHEKSLPVLSMSQGQELSILYACSHCGVIYDVENKEEYILQGHRNSISCLAATHDKKMAIVGDKGPNSIVNVWQVLLKTKQLKPVKTFFNFQEYGVSAVAMSNTNTYLAIISANPVQFLTIWNWTDPSDIPIVEIRINPAYGYQKDIIFNADDSSQLVSNSETRVVFYAWNESMIKSYSHQMTASDLHKIGKFTTTVFFKNVHSALSATNSGKFVVWEKYKSHLLNGLTPFKRIQKIVRMQNKPITVLTTVNKMIVTGDAIGQIKFYDETLKLVNWFQDVNLGSITSISFDFCSESIKSKDDSFMLESYLKGNAFTTPNFIFATSMARFVYVTANGTKYDIVSDDFDCSVVAMDIHPFKPLIAVGGQNGFLKLLHYKNGDSVASKLFENGKQAISCLKYNVDGSMLAVGLSNGKVEVLHGLNLRSFCKTYLNDTNEAVTHIIFSHNMQYMATADAGHAVTLYSIVKDKIWIDENQNFKFIGRYKAHNKSIRTILFRTSAESSAIKLYSLSLDRYLAEYEIVKGLNGLGLKRRDRIEQSALPLCMSSYPRLSRDDFILICNDQFKFKLLNSLSRMCRKTLLGPKFGSPVEKFIASSVKLGSNTETTNFIACMLGDKIAISLLPVTGNQHRSFGMISHPAGVKNIVLSSDGKYMFSVGGSSACLMMWSINLAALEVQERLGGSDLAPFYEQINEGMNSLFMYHLENLFYFAQIRNQGIHTMEKRSVGAVVPLTEIPSIMRALGFFPTEQEIFTMINEVRYENFAETGEIVNSIDVGQFLKLYINHRPVNYSQEQQIQSAFRVLGKKNDEGTFVIEEEEIVKQLLNNGEPMTESELAECLATFSGIRKADICTKQFPSQGPGLVFPQKLDAEQFKNLLGFKKIE